MAKAQTRQVFTHLQKMTASSEQNHFEPNCGRAGLGETHVVHRSWHLPEFPWPPSIPGRSISHRKCQGSLCLLGGLEVGGWVHASLVGTVYFAPGPHCLDTKPPLGGTFSCLYRAPLPTGSASSMSPAQKTILLASTCPSFLLGWGDPSLPHQSAISPLQPLSSDPRVGYSPQPINRLTRWVSSRRGMRGSQGRNYRVFVGYNSYRVSGRFSVGFPHVVASSPMLTFKRAQCRERTPTMALRVPSCFFWVCQEFKALIASPGRFPWVQCVLSNPEGCGNTSPEKQDCFCSLSQQ